MCPPNSDATPTLRLTARPKLYLIHGVSVERDRYLFGALDSSVKNRIKVREASYGYEEPEGILLTSLDLAVNWIRKNSIWPMTFGLACCAIDDVHRRLALDIARLGAEVFRPSPRQADLMIVAGRVAQKMAPVLRRLSASSINNLPPMPYFPNTEPTAGPCSKPLAPRRSTISSP